MENPISKIRIFFPVSTVFLFIFSLFCSPLYATLVSIIYLSRVLCLCVTIAERSAILLVLIIKLTKKTRRRVWTGNEQIMEGGCEETFHCWSQTWETCRFTVPPAVALLNNLSSGKRLVDFFPNCDISQGFSIFYLPEGTAKLWWAGAGKGSGDIIW